MKAIDQISNEYKMTLQGKVHVTFEGLLDAAHSQGLRSIETDLRQAPTEANKWTTISWARVTFADGRVFTGIGDANSTNTNKMVALHSIRMAETRAKCRALRDALNIKGAAWEELGGGDEAQAKPAAATPAPAAAPAETTEDPATDDQKKRIAQLCDKLEWDTDKRQRWLVKRFNKTSRAQLTFLEAEEALKELRERSLAQAGEAA